MYIYICHEFLIVYEHLYKIFCFGSWIGMSCCSYLDFPLVMLHPQTAVAASNDVTEILVVPVETELDFSS